MNNPITVKIESNIGITDEHKNEMREKLVYAFIEQLRRNGMYKVTEEKNGCVWILRADLILPKKYEAEPDNGWISVEKCAPEGHCLVVDANGNVDITSGFIYIADKKSRQFYLRSSLFERFCEENRKGNQPEIKVCIYENRITHWQPLPEPPKGE